MAQKPAGKLSAAFPELAEGRPAVALAAVVFLLLTILSALPATTPERNSAIAYSLGPLVFLSGAAFFAGRSRSAAAPGPEQRFWRKLQVGFVTWSATAFLSLLAPIWGGMGFIRQYTDFGFAVAYAWVVAAVEERPDDRSPATELGRRPALWQAIVLMAGFYGTVVALPTFLNRAEANHYLSSFGFWVFMDLVIAARLAYFALYTSGRRWRFTYLAFGASFIGMMVVDLATFWLLRQGSAPTAGAFYDVGWTLPYALLLVSASSGLLDFENRRGREREPTLSDAFAASSLIWALFFPGFHFAADFVGWLDPKIRPQRDLWILIWTGLLMSLAVLRQRQIEKNLASLVHQRREIEESLKDNEQDLRLLVERARVADRLRAAEERFAKAFEVSPDALVLSVFKDGTILDVNPAFERLSLLGRDACVGRRSLDLHLWPNPKSRERLVQLLQRRQQMHDIPGELRRADGRVRPVRASYERISEPDGDLLLTVLRDSGMGEGSRPGRIATLLENTRIPLRLLHETAEGSEALFANAGARLALRRHPQEDVELAAAGLRLLLHLRSAENDSP